MPPRPTEPVGIHEIAHHLGVTVDAVQQWKRRPPRRQGHPPFPERDGTVSGSPAWHWERITNWLHATGRGRLLESG